MKYYLDVMKYKDKKGTIKLERVPVENITLNEIGPDIICMECLQRRKIGGSKPVSSFIYNGNEERREDGKFFKTSYGDEFNIGIFDTSLSDLKKLILSVKQSDGIYAYFDKSINKEVSVKCMVKSSCKKSIIQEFRGIFKCVSYRGYICLDSDKYIDFNSIYSIRGENINYVNPFVIYSKINYEKYFNLIEANAFSKREEHTLKRRK